MQEELFQSFKKFRVGQVNEDYYDRDEEESEESTAQTLKEVIEIILEDASDDDELSFGLILIAEYADRLPSDVAEEILDELLDFYDVYDDDDDDEGADLDHDEIESLQSESISEETDRKMKKMRFIKNKRKRELGKRADSLEFKRTYKFDTKKKKFVRREKKVSMAIIRKKRRVLKKIARRSSTKIKAQRTKRRLQHVKDPYAHPEPHKAEGSK